jgi:Bacterial protein of unknown function (DUF882)
MQNHGINKYLGRQFALSAAAVALLFVVVTGVNADVSDDQISSDEPRSCVDDFYYDLLPGQTTTIHKEKRPKIYPVEGVVSRRSGIHKVITTLYSVHSREAVPILEGQVPPDGVLHNFFRCRGFSFVHSIDSRLVEALIETAVHFECLLVKIISGYRSPKFNDALAKKGRHVAANSKHTRGQAIDFSLENVDAQTAGKWLWENFDGGVGTYRKDNFIHIDVGRKRRWNGN